MTKLTISLPEEVAPRLASRAEQAGFSTTEEYAGALLLADAAGPPELGDSDLETVLLERLDAPDAGEMTPAVFDEIRRRVRDSLARKAK